ncbi:Response regulator receiver domain-containing protein [Acetitomaculum ruminis DSM 5522]|uniref:Stage 0 sporulation protein A homolog n=1 Tax=Acetitomaculum ruminis DSM 5522 TaxID=1120918 RepID=A0A1I0V7A1_9FIRM|nr:response regulator [Acetitomaculum ruminis]SFA71963.1 Response regulator receiver domain-containing protein [Acetitomaculum ruminis DSM 5522]
MNNIILIIGKSASVTKKLHLELEEKYDVLSIHIDGLIKDEDFRNYVPDIIFVTDELDEEELNKSFRAVKWNPLLANVPLIMYTVTNKKEFVLNSLTKLCNDFLPSSATIEEKYDFIENYTSKKRILIADDDLITLDIIQMHLKTKYKTSAVSSGQQVLSYLVYHTPDLIILDYGMPRMNGLDTLILIRSKAKFKNIPVIMMTGSSKKNTLVEIMNNNASDYLIKPIQKNELLEAVENLIGKNNI